MGAPAADGPDANEVEEVKSVTADELREMFRQCEEGKLTLTPWFEIVKVLV